MPMIDVYARRGTFVDPSALASRLATTLMEVEGVPAIPLFRQNTAAFIHEVTLANVDGEDDRVRVQVLTNAGALDRDKQLAAVRRLTDVVAEAAEDPGLVDRTWVILTETYDGGWGIGGNANTNEDLVAGAPGAHPGFTPQVVLRRRPRGPLMAVALETAEPPVAGDGLTTGQRRVSALVTFPSVSPGHRPNVRT